MVTISETRGTVVAFRAVERARNLLTLLDREHTPEELYKTLRGVRHELDTVSRFLPGGIQHAKNAASAEHRARRARQNTQWHAILRLLAFRANNGATTRDVSEKVGCSIRTARSRIVELAAAGMAEVSDTGRDPVTNRRVFVWRLTQPGAVMLGRLDTEQMPLELVLE